MSDRPPLSDLTRENQRIRTCLPCPKDAEIGQPGARPRRPLLSSRIRPAALVVTSLCAFVTTALGTWYSGDTDAGLIDRVLDTTVQAQIASDHETLDALVILGNPEVVVALSLGLAAAGLILRHRRLAVLALLGPAGASVITELLLKPLFGRTLAGGLAFPSGHTTGVFAAATVAAILVHHRMPSQRRRLHALLVSSPLLPPVAVAIALIGLGHHYATDTVGGCGVGVGVVTALALGLDHTAMRSGPLHDHDLRPRT
jgi:membrane-associated phospholipid phosphatase